MESWSDKMDPAQALLAAVQALSSQVQQQISEASAFLHMWSKSPESLPVALEILGQDDADDNLRFFAAKCVETLMFQMNVEQVGQLIQFFISKIAPYPAPILSAGYSRMMLVLAKLCIIMDAGYNLALQAFRPEFLLVFFGMYLEIAGERPLHQQFRSDVQIRFKYYPCAIAEQKIPQIIEFLMQAPLSKEWMDLMIDLHSVADNPGLYLPLRPKIAEAANQIELFQSVIYLLEKAYDLSKGEDAATNEFIMTTIEILVGISRQEPAYAEKARIWSIIFSINNALLYHPDFRGPFCQLLEIFVGDFAPIVQAVVCGECSHKNVMRIFSTLMKCNFMPECMPMVWAFMQNIVDGINANALTDDVCKELEIGHVVVDIIEQDHAQSRDFIMGNLRRGVSNGAVYVASFWSVTYSEEGAEFAQTLLNSVFEGGIDPAHMVLLIGKLSSQDWFTPYIGKAVEMSIGLLSVSPYYQKKGCDLLVSLSGTGNRAVMLTAYPSLREALLLNLRTFDLEPQRLLIKLFWNLIDEMESPVQEDLMFIAETMTINCQTAVASGNTVIVSQVISYISYLITNTTNIENLDEYFQQLIVPLVQALMPVMIIPDIQDELCDMLTQAWARSWLTACDVIYEWLSACAQSENGLERCHFKLMQTVGVMPPPVIIQYISTVTDQFDALLIHEMFLLFQKLVESDSATFWQVIPVPYILAFMGAHLFEIPGHVIKFATLIANKDDIIRPDGFLETVLGMSLARYREFAIAKNCTCQIIVEYVQAMLRGEKLTEERLFARAARFKEAVTTIFSTNPAAPQLADALIDARNSTFKIKRLLTAALVS